MYTDFQFHGIQVDGIDPLFGKLIWRSFSVRSLGQMPAYSILRCTGWTGEASMVMTFG